MLQALLVAWGLGPFKETDDKGLDRLSFTDTVAAFIGLALDENGRGVAAQDFCQAALNGLSMGQYFGAFTVYHTVHVTDLPAAVLYRLPGAPEKFHGVGILPSGIRRREKAPDVPQSGGPQEGVGDGMGKDIPITVSVLAARCRYFHTGEQKASTFDQTVKIPSQSDAYHAGRSAGKVILRFCGIPGIACTAPQ